MAETVEQTIEKLRQNYPGEILETRQVGLDEIFVTVPATYIVAFCKFLIEQGWWHLTTITGQDLGESIQLLYHFNGDESPSITAVTEIGVDEPKIASITPDVPAATMYEREINDLLGVVFEGHPRPGRLVLPDDWPEGVYPLRLDEIQKRAERDSENG